MAGGIFQGLGKLFDAGASYLQHQQFLEKLRGMQLEDAKAQLATYVRGMSDSGFNGLKLALTLLAKGTTDPSTLKLLNALLGSLETVRRGAPASAPNATASPQPAVTQPARSFDDDLTMVASWYDLDEESRISAMSEHIVSLTPEAFLQFREHVARMVNNAAEQIRQHEASEDNAWGSYAEDRMAYMMARLRTGQRDPAFVARLQEMQRYAAFYQWVLEGCDLVWQERERRLKEAQAAEAKAQAPAPPADGGPKAMIAMLRVQLEQGLASGQVRADRRVSYERLLDKMEALMSPLSDPNLPVTERAKLIDRFRGLMAEFQQSYMTPGAADRLDGLSATARARTLETWIGQMKAFLYRELAQSPPQHTAERAGELLGDLTRAHTEIAQLADDEAAVAFEREVLRVTAKGLHDFAHREHLMLARPLWQCAEVMPSPHGLFVAGASDLAAMMQQLAEHRDLDIASAGGQYYGQARWDALRSSHVGIFDLRGYRPDLARTDAAAAAALGATAYELGLAFALGRPVVIVTRPAEALPFDIDIAPCEIADAGDASRETLASALDAAWYGRQRTTGVSGLDPTFEYLERSTRDLPRRRMLEASGLLERDQLEDPIGFIGSVKQILREQGLGDLQTIFPAWPGRYPDEAMPTVFHVMPFSESWSDESRDAARAAGDARGYTYRRGDEADEGRIIQAIWEDICAAHVVLVDITGLNVNVLIELGMAHALGRTVLMVRRASQRSPLPRNIEKLRVLDYDSPAALARVLESRLTAARRSN